MGPKEAEEKGEVWIDRSQSSGTEATYERLATSTVVDTGRKEQHDLDIACLDIADRYALEQ